MNCLWVHFLKGTLTVVMEKASVAKSAVNNVILSLNSPPACLFVFHHHSLILLFFSLHYLPSHLSNRFVPLLLCSHSLCNYFCSIVCVLFLSQTHLSLFCFTFLFAIL